MAVVTPLVLCSSFTVYNFFLSELLVLIFALYLLLRK